MLAVIRARLETHHSYTMSTALAAAVVLDSWSIQVGAALQQMAKPVALAAAVLSVVLAAALRLDKGTREVEAIPLAHIQAAAVAMVAPGQPLEQVLVETAEPGPVTASTAPLQLMDQGAVAAPITRRAVQVAQMLATEAPAVQAQRHPPLIAAPVAVAAVTL
jgi:hypothetical protein